MHEPVEQADGGGGGVLGQEPGPMDSKHQRLAMPSECCSVAAATTRNSSRIPMSFSGAKAGPDRTGIWHLVRADRPADTFRHVRRVLADGSARSGAGGASSAPLRRSGPESATR